MSQPKLNEQRNIEMLRTPMLKDIGQGVLLFLASRASILGMFPFGVAFFASCFDKSIAYVGITILSVALMTASASMLIVKYLTASLLFWIYTRFRPKGVPVYDSAACGASMFVGGSIFLLYSFSGIYDVLMLFAESVASAMMFIIFQKTKYLAESRKKRAQTAQDELISVAVFTGVMITGLNGIILPYGISLANIISIYAVMCIANGGGIAAAGSGGLCIGFVASMSSSSAVVMTGIFGISALFGNLLKIFGRVGVTVGFIAGSSIAMLYAGSAYNLPVTAVETVVGAVLFASTPDKLVKKISAFFMPSLKIEPIRTDDRVKEYLSMRLIKSADAFRSLAKCLEEASEKRLKAYAKDASALLDEVAERVCDGCHNISKCWQSNFARTYKSMMNLLGVIEKDGILNIGSMPCAFREKCIRAELFIVEFNHIYELYKKNLVRAAEAAESRDIAAAQYNEFAELMEGMAAEINEGFGFREDIEENIVSELDKAGIMPFEVSVTEAARGKIEVYLSTAKGAQIPHIEDILTELVSTPMGYDMKEGSGVMKFVSKARYDVEIAISQENRDYTRISGDSADTFKTNNYKQYVIIADGMGSGKRAMMESRAAAGLMKKFIMSGFSVETAADMINSAMCLKLDDEYFSSIDLLCIDLMTGICEFYKIGAAESMILHGNNTETVFSASLPAGILSEIKIQPQVKRLADGDLIIMMSDGVSEAGFGTARADWIKKEIRKNFNTAEEMAQAVIDTAIQKGHGAVEDDMTAAVIRLKEN